MIKHYPYRFKTEQEFIKEFGNNWIQCIEFGWNPKMNVLFGKPFMNEFSENDITTNKICVYKIDQNNDMYDNNLYVISWDMLTKNDIIYPDYKPKTKIERVI